MKKDFLKKYNNKKGIGLIELVVSVSVFSLVVIAASAIFMNSIRAQKVMLAQQNVAENMRYVMEFMVKELRMTQMSDPINLTFQKTTGEQLNYANSPSESVIFTNYNNDTITYYLLDGKVMRNDGSGDQPISSDEVEIVDLDFLINNWDLASGPSPLITIIFKAKALNGVGNIMDMQTSVSPRIY